MTSDAKSTVGIKCRIAAAKSTFMEIKAILINLMMPFQLRYRILTCCMEVKTGPQTRQTSGRSKQLNCGFRREWKSEMDRKYHQ